jgi:hypothetical protein
MAAAAYERALEALEVFVGEWELEASFDLDPAFGPARASFEWALDRTFVLQRSQVPHPEAPDALSVIAADPRSGAYTMHYFDSRGVVRVYEMSLADDAWTLLRTSADFSPLPFAQRYTGRFEDGGAKIAGRWEKSADGANWELDFELDYLRVEPR